MRLYIFIEKAFIIQRYDMQNFGQENDRSYAKSFPETDPSFIHRQKQIRGP